MKKRKAEFDEESNSSVQMVDDADEDDFVDDDKVKPSTVYTKEKFVDTIGVIRSRKSKNKKIQWPKEKGQTMIYKTLHRKLKIKQHEPH